MRRFVTKPRITTDAERKTTGLHPQMVAASGTRATLLKGGGGGAASTPPHTCTLCTSSQPLTQREQRGTSVRPGHGEEARAPQPPREPPGGTGARLLQPGGRRPGQEKDLHLETEIQESPSKQPEEPSEAGRDQRMTAWEREYRSPHLQQ